jgi:hypothetical protein
MKIGLLNLLLDLYKLGTFKNLENVLDLGSKEIRVSYNDLKYSLNQVNLKIPDKRFEVLKKFPKGKRISTGNVWKLISKTYSCADINKSHNSIFLDLNKPFKNKKYLGKFDLVNDFGNNEHVFNVGQAYQTMYDLCKKNGLIWITQSIYGGNGFFHFDQSFFEGFAAANDLSIIHMAYVINVGDYKQYLIPCDKDLLKVLNLNSLENLDITCLFRKKTDKKFNFYYQYNFDKKNSPFIRTFLNQSYPPEKIYIPTKNLSELKKSAIKGDKDAITWLRATGYKI